MEIGLTKEDWEVLIDRIKKGKCTPFIGAGACHGIIPLGKEIARRWANEYQYPLADNEDLTRVAQYMAIKHDDFIYPKDKIVDILKNVNEESTTKNQTHNILASLPLPVYITTNYDSLMLKALQKELKTPHMQICKWNSRVTPTPEKMPSPTEPLVFYLHGHETDHNSIVLTEDDYLDFLVNSQKNDVLPPRIKEAISGSSLMFLGYSLNDWTFKVLFRGLINSLEGALRVKSISVQIDKKNEDVRRYLDKYFRHMKISVYWGTCEEFLTELNRRWNGNNGK